MSEERHPLFVNNVPIDEKRIAFIEKVVARLSRRARKTATAMTSPYPISNAVFGDKVEGVMLRYMFPCEGEITKGAIDLGKKPKQGITVNVSIMGEEVGESKDFVLTKRRLSIDPMIKVKAFDRLTVTISYTSEKPENDLTEFWASLLWVPTVKDAVAKSFLIEELDNGILETKSLSESESSVGG